MIQELNGNYNNNSYMEKNHINLSLEVDSKLTSQMEVDGIDDELYEELFQLICDVICVERKTIRIEGQEYPYEVVKARFLKLKISHLLYVIQCMQNTTSKIGNIKGYMLTALYNAPSTMKHYYQQAVLSEIL